MIEAYHLLIALFLVLALPAVMDFALSLIKLASQSPVANPIVSANSQNFKAYTSGTFRQRMECGPVRYLCVSLINAANIFAFGIVAKAFDFEGIELRLFFTCMLAVTLFAMITRAFLYVELENRINFSRLLNSFMFSSTSLILVFAGFSFSLNSGNVGWPDLIIWILAQFAIYIDLMKSFEPASPVNFFEKHTAMAMRMGINLMLLSFVGLQLIQPRREHLFLAVGVVFLLELFMNLFSFESLRARSEKNEIIERIFLGAICVSIGLKVLL